jgi:hypothetical protein
VSLHDACSACSVFSFAFSAAPPPFASGTLLDKRVMDVVNVYQSQVEQLSYDLNKLRTERIEVSRTPVPLSQSSSSSTADVNSEPAALSPIRKQDSSPDSKEASGPRAVQGQGRSVDAAALQSEPASKMPAAGSPTRQGGARSLHADNSDERGRRAASQVHLCS